MAHGSFNKMLRETIHESQKCQRNWDLSKDIPQEDKDLIGGVIIRAGDSVVDASLRGRLKELNNIIAQ